MLISKKLEEILISKFKTEEKIKNSIKLFEIYKFQDLNQKQVLSLFAKEEVQTFSENNSKKHFTKIIEKIKMNFNSNKTNHYLSILLNPSFNENELLFRKEVLDKLILKSKTIKDKNLKLKLLFKEIYEFNEKISFPNQIISLESKTSEILYDKYKINSLFLTRKQLEESFETLDENCIILNEENLLIEFSSMSFKEFEKIIFGKIILKNKELILNILSICELFSEDSEIIKKKFKEFTNQSFNFSLEDIKFLKENLKENPNKDLEDMTTIIQELETQTKSLNKKLEEKISSKKLSLEGDELLKLLESGDIASLQKKVSRDISELIFNKEKEIKETLKSFGLKSEAIFENHAYPVELDKETVPNLLEQVEEMQKTNEFENYKRLSKFNLKQIFQMTNFIYFADFISGINKFIEDLNLNYPIISEKEFALENAKNIFIENPIPINYGLGTEKINKITLNNERVSVITGANSGGKTTLLEMLLQSQVLQSLGLGICSDKNSRIKHFEKIIYLKKFTGALGSGAFEQTIRNIVEIIDDEKSKLILIDEFEAVTEPGAAASILVAFLKEISKTKDSFCVAATHLGAEIKDILDKDKLLKIRIDGISASGLGEKGELITNHQPIFYSLGKSTPQLILKKVLNDKKFWKDKKETSKDILSEIIGEK